MLILPTVVTECVLYGSVFLFDARPQQSYMCANAIFVGKQKQQSLKGGCTLFRVLCMDTAFYTFIESHAINYFTLASACPQGDALLPSANHGQIIHEMI